MVVLLAVCVVLTAIHTAIAYILYPSRSKTVAFGRGHYIIEPQHSSAARLQPGQQGALAFALQASFPGPIAALWQPIQNGAHGFAQRPDG